MTLPAPPVQIRRSARYSVSGRRRAFTITELLIVSAILSILSLAAIGGYTQFRESRAIGTAGENLVAAFQAARSFAISTNSPHRLVIQTRNPMTGAEQVTYWVDEIFAGTNDNPFPTVPETARTAKVTTPETLPEGVRLYDVFTRDTTATATSQPYAVIRFFRDGSTDGARLRLMDDNVSDPANARRLVTVRMSSATGQSHLRLDRR